MGNPLFLVSRPVWSALYGINAKKTPIYACIMYNTALPVTSLLIQFCFKKTKTIMLTNYLFEEKNNNPK